MDSFDQKATAFNIHSARIDSQMTMQAVADACGVSVAAVAKWESAKSMPTISNLVTICSLFRCGIQNIISTKEIA